MNVPCLIEGPATVCGDAQAKQYCGPADMDSYAWTITGNGVIVGPTKARCVAVNAGANGSYTLTLAVKVGTCGNACEKTVTIGGDVPCEIAGQDQVCVGGIGNVYCGPEGQGLTYQWSIEGIGTIVGPTSERCVSVDALLPTISAAVAQASNCEGCSGSFTLVLTVTAPDGCSHTCMKIVTVTPKPTCNIQGSLEVCEGSLSNQYCGPVGMAYL